MSISVQTHLDPAVEAILLLERIYGGGSIPSSIEGSVTFYAEKFNIPIVQLEALVQPLKAMESELSAILEPHEELWGDMFYSNSKAENLLAWGFFYLEREKTRMVFDTLLRRRLIALMLDCSLGSLDGVEDLHSLMAFLERFPGSNQTKWICARLWQEPERFYDKYRRMVALAEPVVAKFDTELQPLIRETVSMAQQALREDPMSLWDQLGMTSTAYLDNLILCPMANNFGGMGIIWDHTAPEVPALLMIGLLRQSIYELGRRYGDNSEFLTDRLKSLSDQRRIEILKALKSAPMYGQELADLLSLSPATISHHMSSLISAGFVSVDRRGSKTSYTLHRQNLDAFLRNLRFTLLNE